MDGGTRGLSDMDFIVCCWPVIGMAIGTLVAKYQGGGLVLFLFLGAVLGPFVTLAFLSSPTRYCPYCHVEIPRYASVCCHCTRDLPTPRGKAHSGYKDTKLGMRGQR